MSEREADAPATEESFEAWIARRAAEPRPDFEPVLAQLHTVLAQLAAQPIIARDGEAQWILRKMSDAPDMEAFHAEMEALAARTQALLTAGRASPLADRSALPARAPRVLFRL